MTIEQIEAMDVFSPEELEVIDIKSRVFNPGSTEVVPEDMPKGEFWKATRLSGGWDMAELYWDGEYTGYTLDDRKWDDPSPKAPMCRVSRDEEYEVNDEIKIRTRAIHFGSFEDVYEKLMTRFEEPKSELEQLYDSVFETSNVYSSDDKVPHIAWVSSGDESMTEKIAGLVLDGKETPYRMRLFNGFGKDMPGYQFLEGDRLIYQGNLPNAVERGVMRAEKDCEKVQEKTHDIGARVLALAGKEAA